MRVLFSTTSAAGHALPLVPLAWALRSAGHDVLFVTQGPAPFLRSAGFGVVELVPPGHDPADPYRGLREAAPQLYERMLQLQSEPMEDLRDGADFFGAVGGFVAPAVLEIAAGWGPELVVSSSLDAAGMVVAAALDAAFVRHSASFARATGLEELFAEHMAETLDGLGIDGPPRTSVVLDVAPPDPVPAAPGHWRGRYLPFGGGCVLPPWLREEPERPRIAVTPGTVVTGEAATGWVRPIVDAAADLDVELVVALPGQHPSALGELPANTRVTDYIPTPDLLATCRGIVHHGGGGTTLTALASGVPQLVLVAGGADRLINARGVAERGAGLAPQDAAPDAALLERLLTDDALLEATRDVQAQMAALPEPAETVPQLAALVAER